MAKTFDYLAYAYRVIGNKEDDLEIMHNIFSLVSNVPITIERISGLEWATREVQRQISLICENWKLNGIWIQPMPWNKDYDENIKYIFYGNYELDKN
jgi:hypothetical protein